MDTDASRLATAQAMIDAWHARDWVRVGELFAEDGVLHSMMVEPVRGRAAIAARIAHLGAGIEHITLDIRSMGVIDGRVFMERVDRFRYRGKDGAVPVTGVLEIRDGRVQVWREYYDRAMLLREMGLAVDFAQSVPQPADPGLSPPAAPART